MHYDILSKLKNAQAARKEVFLTPYTNFDAAVAAVLARAGYVKDVQKKVIGKKTFLELRVSYHRGVPAMADFRIFSKPGRRLYSGYNDLKPVKQNFGIAILSTPKGIMNNKDARREKVGGEYLCEIW